ncbi:MAG TPA: hypothetical protein VLM43_03030, partial [Desulfobacterales bacterium]|nr:hypothetical protein [Desulfobacterales bacterium]
RNRFLESKKPGYYRNSCNKPTSHLKNTSNAQLQRCEPLQNVLLIRLSAGLRFFIGPRLVLELNLHF